MSIPMKNMSVTIRRSTKDDMGAVLEMIQELAAEMGHNSDGPQLTLKDLQRDGFELERPAFYCKVAELPPPAKDVKIGYALFFPTYSTWEGKAMMLEDLFVKSKYRRCGIGNKLFNAVAKEAYSSGCSRLDFHVLKWNDARNFYDRKGAVNITYKEGWCYYRLTGDSLKDAACQNK